MRKLMVAIVIVLLLIECKTLDKLTQFNMGYETSVTIPGIENSFIPEGTEIPDVSVSGEFPDIATNLSDFLEENNTSPDLIEKVTLTDAVFTITLPEDKDFSSIRSLDIYLKADGLDDVLVAWADSIPDDVGNELILETSDADLQDYLLKDTMAFKVETVIHKMVTSDYEIELNSNFLVDAKILGI